MKLRFSALILICLICIGVAFPCGIAVPPGQSMLLTQEDVIIVWDKEHGIEHFIRKAVFKGDQKSFGFIVPTPSIPNLEEVDSDVYDIVAYAAMPHPIKFSCSLSDSEAGAAAAVSVISEQQVGKYKAAILKATDGNALNDWLKKNGYASRPALTAWLDGYAKKNWIFTAFKFTGDAEDHTKNAEIDSEAIRLSFKTDRPHYPYSRPGDAWQAGVRQPMKVYFISSGPIAARYEGTNKDWEADETFTGDIREDAAQEIAQQLNLNRDDLPKHPVVTAFDNSKSSGLYSTDLYFVNTFRLSWITIAVAVAIAAVLIYAWRRRKLAAKNI